MGFGDRYLDLLEERKKLSQKVIENVITAGAESIDPNVRMIFVRDAANFIASSDEILEKTVDLLIKTTEQNAKLTDVINKIMGLGVQEDENSDSE